MSHTNDVLSLLIEFDPSYTEKQTLHLMRLWSSYIRVHLSQQELFLSNWSLIANHLGFENLNGTHWLERSFYETVKSHKEQISNLESLIEAGSASVAP